MAYPTGPTGPGVPGNDIPGVPDPQPQPPMPTPGMPEEPRDPDLTPPVAIDDPPSGGSNGLDLPPGGVDPTFDEPDPDISDDDAPADDPGSDLPPPLPATGLTDRTMRENGLGESELAELDDDIDPESPAVPDDPREDQPMRRIVPEMRSGLAF